MNTLIFGILSGGALSAIAYYRIATGDDGAVVVFGGVAAVCWLVGGFLAARGVGSTLAGALTGFLSGALGAVIGLIAHQYVMQQYGDAWYQRVTQACAQSNPPVVCADKTAFLANEASFTIIALIAWPLVALLLGAIAGFVGSTSASHRLLGDEYQDGTITLNPPLVPSHRTLRAQGQDIFQGDRPTF